MTSRAQERRASGCLLAARVLAAGVLAAGVLAAVAALPANAGLTGDTIATHSAPTAARGVVAPASLIRQEVRQLYEFFRTNPVPAPETLRGFVEEQIAPHFDFDYMARWAAGPYLRRLNGQQLGQLAAQVRELFIGGLTRGLGLLGPTIPRARVLQARPGGDAREQVVPVLVTLRPGWNVRLSFRCYWTGETWQVFDASLNGASAVMFFRRHFADLLRRHGPQALN